MTKPHYSPLHSLVQKIAASRPGSWFFSRTLHHFDRIYLKLSGGRKTLTSSLAGLPTAILTTTGAKSGLARTLPLVFIRDDNNPNSLALIASNWGQNHHPGWYFNLRANPHASCAIDGQIKAYISHEASAEEYERFWQYASEIYVGYPLYKQRAGDRHIPIMVLNPEQSSPAKAMN